MTDSPEDWVQTLEQIGELTPQLTTTILEKHGNRAQKAITAVCEHRIKQYKDFTVVVGHHTEHIIENNACMCDDVKYNLDPNDPDSKCWHELATTIAETLDLIDTHDYWYGDIAKTW